MIDRDPPNVSLRVPKESVAAVAGRLLTSHDIDDLTVEDPPIDEVIRRMYESAAASDATLRRPEPNADA